MNRIELRFYDIESQSRIQFGPTPTKCLHYIDLYTGLRSYPFDRRTKHLTH